MSIDSGKRAVLNTLAQNLKALANIVLSFYSTRIVLSALGASDYGVFSLVAGIVSMLGFITNAMVITTQRHLSYQHGCGDLEGVRSIFANSYFLHILLGGALTIVLFGIAPLLFGSGFLQIDMQQRGQAQTAYYVMTVVLLVSFVSAPFRALFVARENIVYISIIDIIDGVLKLLMAFLLFLLSGHRIVAYSCIMVFIMMFNLLAQAIYARLHYPECCLLPSPRLIQRSVLRQISGFAGWTFYSMGCIISRTQGLAIILNRSAGTLANASYGIAMQVVGAVQFLGQAILNALAPQIIKAEGSGDRESMLHLSALTSKYAVFLVALAVIPIAWEMPSILHFWLGQVPEHTAFFCRMTLIAAVCDQLTVGLGTANQAVGQIRNYSLTINSIKLITLPTAALCIHWGLPIASVMWCYLGFELLCALARIPFLQQTAGLSVKDYAHNVFALLPVPLIVLCLTGFLCTQYMEFPLRFLVTLPASALAGGVAVWYFGIRQTEREALKNIIASYHKNRHR